MTPDAPATAASVPSGLAEPAFDPNAMRVLKERYFAKKADGIVESPREFLWRVASSIAEPERPYAVKLGRDADAVVDGVSHAFYEMMARRDFMPNTPCLVNAGRPLSMLSACFVLPVPDSIEGIFYNLKAMALIQKSGGGTGFAFSELRHQGAEVQSTGKDASGPVSFMKVFNAATDSIKQGGVRRGANMGVLRVDHPDVFHFMSCKKELDAENRALWNRFSDTGRYTDVELAHLKQELLQTQINNFNISVGVTDEFMQAVKDGSDFALLDPRTREVVKTVPAREIWDAIVEGAWQNGEPGVLFLDHPHVNPLPGLGPIAATNPCVTADTWVFTSQGARRVRELVGVAFEAVVDGRAYPSSPGGFFFTGNKAVFRVKTSRGFEVDATADHPLLVERNGVRTWTKVGDLSLGDTLVLHDHADAAWKGRGNFAEGRALGTLLSDGQLQVDGAQQFRFRRSGDGLIGEPPAAEFRRAPSGPDARRTTVAAATQADVSSAVVAELAHAYGLVRETLHVTDEIESASSAFICGFLQSWFDADGSVRGDFHDGGSVRLVSISDADLAVAQRMLARLGIVSTVFRERLADTGRIYHKLVISRRDMVRFANRVGFSDEAKQRRLLAVIDARKPDFRDRHRTEVTAIEPLGTAPVFDCTIPGVHAFDANGLYAHNCGEQFLHGYDSCNLGSINVGHFYDAGAKDVDWDRLGQTTAVALRFLDNVIDANIYPIDEIRDMVTNNRRVGLGIMGFADLLIQMQIAYGSPEAVTFADKLMAFIQQRAADTSETLARERGDFPNKHLSIWAEDPRPRRNAALLSIAPTGTISMIAGCSFGCEPYFGMAYTKHVMKDAEGRPQHLYYIVPLFEEISKDEGFFSEELLGKIEENRGSLKGIAGVPQHWQDVFTVAADVTVDQHIDMLAAFQKHTDNAVSKCVAEGTLIPTDRGLIPIERMGTAAEGSFGELNDEYHVISHDGVRRRVTGFYNNGRVKTVRVRTKNGATLEASQSHHVLTITGWKSMSDLQVGDLIVGRFEALSGEGGARIDVAPYPFRNTATNVTLPDAMSPDLALWLGMIAADGHTIESTGNVGISERDESGDVARTFDGLCVTLFGLNPRVAVDKRTGVRTRYLTSRALSRYVADLVGKGAANKHVPEQILKGSSAEKVAFLNGVSLDGYVAHDAHRNALVLYAGISGRLADEMEALCRSLGVPSCYRWTDTKADGYVVHQVRVTAELQALLDPIERRKITTSVNPHRLVRVPDDVFAVSVPHTHSEYSNLRSLKQRRPLHCFASTLEKLHVPLADPREYLVKVSSIEMSEAHTYDIEVEESHSYVVNGLVSHNTINAPNDDTRENVSRAIFRAYEAGCKGFTYYRDGSRTEQVVTFSKDGDLAGGNRDVASADPKPAQAAAVNAEPVAPATERASANDELDIDALLAKANALLEVR